MISGQFSLIFPPVCLVAALLATAPFATVASAQTKRDLEIARNRMVDEEIVAAGVKDARVIESLRTTPRHEFVTSNQRSLAYFDMALPIGNSQTISPPFVVAYMTEQLQPQAEDKVLEIGTGSGYQAAVLSPLVKEVYSIEIVEPLGQKAARVLKRLKYDNVFTRVGDGFKGWPEKAPFDKIIVTCSPEKVPVPLIEQLREGGQMIVPVGERYQQVLYLFTKKDGKLVNKALLPTLFVPMTGAAEEKRQVLPDPLKPTIVNGSFEDLLGDKKAASWHYQRQMEVVVDANDAKEGEKFARFTNDTPGRGAQALQGFAVDGRKLNELQLTLWVRGNKLRYGDNRQQWPRLVITFYDDARARVGEATVGPWIDTFDWIKEEKRIALPPKAREAIIHVGLIGGIGELDIDDIRLKAVPKKSE